MPIEAGTRCIGSSSHRRGRPLRIVLLWVEFAVAGSSTSSCGARPEAEPGPADVTVELDAYSGRRNPVWTLTPTDAALLADRLLRLPELSDSAAPEPILGYRGFWIRNPEGEGGIPERVYVARGGIVQIFAEEERWRGYSDDAGIEAWLIENARRQGYGELFP
jgi:hypothetical protein